MLYSKGYLSLCIPCFGVQSTEEVFDSRLAAGGSKAFLVVLKRAARILA